MRRRQYGSNDHGRGSGERSGDVPGASETFRVNGQIYHFLKQLSLPERGRWLVKEGARRQGAPIRLAVLLPRGDETAQLRRSLLRLPAHASSLPRLLNHGSLKHDYCLILDWVPGIDFGEYLQRVRAAHVVRPSVTELVRLFAGVAHSLRVLHEICGVVHGDLKPANLILTSKPSALRLIDFGSSWQLERAADSVEGDGSDPTYRAPELSQDGCRWGPQSDQFSLGVILYLALTLEVPFEGLGGKIGRPEIRDALAGEAELFTPPSRLVENRDKIPAILLDQVDQIVRTLLAIHPAQRFPHARACCDAFDQVQAEIRRRQFADTEDNSLLMKFWEIVSRGSDWFYNRREN